MHFALSPLLVLAGYGDREGYQDGYSSDGDGYGDQYDPVADPQ